MITLIESNESGKYIGGKLYDLTKQADFVTVDGVEAFTELIDERSVVQDNYIATFSKYYICCRPDEGYQLWTGDIYSDIHDMWDSMAIKDGADLIAYPNYLKAVGYYNMRDDVVYLYPITKEKATELRDIIDDADFDESDVIENEIAQYAWNGASAQDVLLSWCK